MKNFKERERFCNATFLSGGPYWHVYTSGKETPLIFSTKEEFTLAMNMVAQAQASTGVTLLAFEIMGNHFHFVISADKEQILNFWNLIRKRMIKPFPLIKNITPSLKPIDNLQSLRNNIVYTNRNGYVADPSHTPFSYPWGTGRYYFQNFPTDRLYAEIHSGQRRLMFRGRDPDLPEHWKVIDGHICPSSFCSIKTGMAMFRDAHHYFSLVSKNVEAYSEIASELGDGEFLTDPELYNQLAAILKKEYGAMLLKDLSRQQKLDLAVRLRREFRSSNGQIRRLLALSQYEIDALFPLTA